MSNKKALSWILNTINSSSGFGVYGVEHHPGMYYIKINNTIIGDVDLRSPVSKENLTAFAIRLKLCLGELIYCRKKNKIAK